MWMLIAAAYLMGAILLVCGIGGIRRRLRWLRADRREARVVSVVYQEAWLKDSIIEDKKSRTQVWVEFFEEGQICRKNREYEGILDAPSYRGKKLAIFYDPINGEWIPARQLRPFWILQLFFGLLSLAAAMAFSFRGNRMLANLAEYTAETPNPAGSFFYFLLGTAALTLGTGGILALLPMALRPVLSPFWWGLQSLLGMLDEVPARCIGLIRKKDGDGGDEYYPFFSCETMEGRSCWPCRQEKGKGEYGVGEPYSLYRNVRSGAFSLKPTERDLLRAVWGVVPLGFGMLVLAAISAFGVFLAAFGVVPAVFR